jgi:hydroxylamine reductase (hybrid-cluster protein)
MERTGNGWKVLGILCTGDEMTDEAYRKPMEFAGNFVCGG